MVFHNPGKQVLRFKLADLSFVVPPNGELDIPKPLAYMVTGRGLLLVEGSSPIKGERVEAFTAPAKKQVLPPGVAIGRDPELDGEDEIEDEGDPSAVVEKAVADLNAEGIRLPAQKQNKKGK
jgi:hypothetical protein